VPAIRKRVLVSGRVQGVFFRAFTAREGKRLGLAGWVRNLADGRVEVLAEGEPEPVEDLVRWLWKGSPLSRVDAVEARDEEPRGDLAPFDVRG
jgi:acylphosphatase